jgi:MFS transporter, DHA2 family, multidrug resistance protein
MSKQELKMVAVLLTGTFIAVLNATLLTPALPTIMRDLDVTSTTVQWLTSGYALTEAVVIPLAAYLMGRFSTRRLFIGGIGLFCAGSVVAACAPAFGFLLAGRVMQACATGFVMPMVFSVILLIIPRERRGSAMGVIGLIIGFAPTIGPSLSGVLVDTVGWRAIFAIVAVLAGIVVLLAIKELKPYGEFRRGKFDAPSVVLSTVGLVSLLYGLSSFSSSDNLAVTVALIVVGLALVGAYAYRQLHLDEPMLRIDILKTKQYRTVVIIIALFQASLIGIETIMPLYIQGVLGQSATVSGMAMLPGAVIGAFTGLFAGRLFDKHGVRRPVLIGVCGVACALVGFVSYQVDSPILMVTLVYSIMAVGIQFTMTPVNTWGVNSLPNEAIQHAQSTSNTINQVAGSFGTALLVSVAAAGSAAHGELSGVQQTFAGYHVSFCTTTCLVACAIVLILVFVRDSKKAKASAGTADADCADKAKPGSAAGDASADAGTGDDAFDVINPNPAFKHAADKALAGFTLEEVMNENAVTVRDTAAMREVIELIAKTNTTGVSVVDESGKLVGYVTDGDIMRYLSRIDFHMSSPQTGMSISVKDEDEIGKRLSDLAGLNVMELATTRVISVDVDTPIDVACGILAGRRIKKMPVTRDGVLVGALSRRNILHTMVNVYEGKGDE